jgi:class III poly(R)-hydroxyalkanoic acid synthase PhaE subunit
MNEDPRQGDWIGGWIDEQRRLIEKMAQARGAGLDPALRDMSLKWLDAGQSYLQGWAQFAGGAAPSGQAPSAIGEDLLNAWRGAWMGPSSAGPGLAGAFAELLSRVPPLGLAREQTEAWRELAAAQAECQKLEQELRVVLTRVQSDALALLEQRIGERSQAGKSVATYRELYDLWVECGEKVYADVAHSEPYCRLQAQMGNATMRLRSRLQTVIESGLRQFDLPTRSELNTVHRQVRELKARVAELEQKLAATTTRGASL